MGADGLHCAREKVRLFWGRGTVGQRESSWHQTGEDRRGPWDQGEGPRFSLKVHRGEWVG